MDEVFKVRKPRKINGLRTFSFFTIGESSSCVICHTIFYKSIYLCSVRVRQFVLFKRFNSESSFLLRTTVEKSSFTMLLTYSHRNRLKLGGYFLHN